MDARAAVAAIRSGRKIAAVQQVLPLSYKEASAEAVNAIAYATRHHSEWFWQGAQHEESRVCDQSRPANAARRFQPAAGERLAWPLKGGHCLAWGADDDNGPLAHRGP